jgi:hypothetical protein
MLHVGVGTTREAELFRKWYPEMVIVGFDPGKRVPANYPGEFHQVAISDFDGEVAYHDGADRGSVCPKFGEKKTGRIVQCRTLDAVIEESSLKGPFLLWMDCDGSEAKVLRGGESVLANAGWVYSEGVTSIERCGWPDADEVIGLIYKSGFRLFSEPDPNDFVFVNPDVLDAESRRAMNRRLESHRVFREIRHLSRDKDCAGNWVECWCGIKRPRSVKTYFSGFKPLRDARIREKYGDDRSIAITVDTARVLLSTNTGIVLCSDCMAKVFLPG